MTLEEIREAIKHDKKNSLLYYRAGFLEEKNGDYEQALKDYKRVVKLKSRQKANAYYRMGVTWETMGAFYDLEGKFGDAKGRMVDGPHLDKAISMYKRAIKARRGFADPYYSLILAYLIRYQIKEARKAYKKLQQIDPDSERTHQVLLAIYERHKKHNGRH